METGDSDLDYTEKLVRMSAIPDFERQPAPIAPVRRADFDLPERGPLYLCPQKLAKFHPAHDELLRRVLEEDPCATLVLIAHKNKAVLSQLLTRFGKTLGEAAAQRAGPASTNPGPAS